jgi:hypothetical protein
MDAKQFLDELDKKVRATRPNQQSHIFAKRAMNVITAAYDLNPNSSNFGNVRKEATPEQIEKANKLIELGITEAIYGKGRVYLRS